MIPNKFIIKTYFDVLCFRSLHSDKLSLVEWVQQEQYLKKQKLHDMCLLMLGLILVVMSSYSIQERGSLVGKWARYTFICSIRGRPFLRTVFLICTMCKFGLTHPPTPQFAQMRDENTYHHLICTADIFSPTHLNLHLVQIGKTIRKNGPSLTILGFLAVCLMWIGNEL